MGEVESELDSQLAAAEERARRLERERLEKEKEDMRARLEVPLPPSLPPPSAPRRRPGQAEIRDLSSNIRRLQKMENSLTDSQNSGKLAELKSHLEVSHLCHWIHVPNADRVEDLNRENRNLKSNLTSKQTEMVLIKSQMAQVRLCPQWASQLDRSARRCVCCSCARSLRRSAGTSRLRRRSSSPTSRSRRISTSSSNSYSFWLLPFFLSAQVNCEHWSDANTKLHDTNDQLRSTIESKQAFFRQCNIVSSLFYERHWGHTVAKPVHTIGGSRACLQSSQ